MVKLLGIIAVGGIGGFLLGSTRSCEDGGCPLTATPLRGSVYGACLAALFGLSTLQSSGCRPAPPERAPSPHLVALSSSADFESKVLSSSLPCLVDFYADWCGPCKQLSPVMHELADDFSGRARIVKVNVDDHGELAKRYGVRSIPDVRLFVGGEVVEQFIGVQPKSRYSEGIEKALSGDASGE